MVTSPTATGAVGGKPLSSSVSEKKTPMARQNAATHTNAFATRSYSFGAPSLTRRECSSRLEEASDRGIVGCTREQPVERIGSTCAPALAPAGEAALFEEIGAMRLLRQQHQPQQSNVVAVQRRSTPTAK